MVAGWFAPWTAITAFILVLHMPSGHCVRVRVLEDFPYWGHPLQMGRTTGLPAPRSYWARGEGAKACNLKCGVAFTGTSSYTDAATQLQAKRILTGYSLSHPPNSSHTPISMPPGSCGYCSGGASQYSAQRDCKDAVAGKPEFAGRTPAYELVGHSFACCYIFSCDAVFTVEQDTRCCAYKTDRERRMWVKPANQTAFWGCPNLPNGVEGNHVESEECPPVVYPGGCTAQGCASTDPQEVSEELAGEVVFYPDLENAE